MTALAVLFRAGMVRVGATHAYTFCMVTARRPGPVHYIGSVVRLYESEGVTGLDGAGLAIIDVDG